MASASGSGSVDRETENGNTNGKRKSEDGTPSQPRAKRNRYISIACNECKRRKIKCNGQTPCQRCGNLQLECMYAPNCCNNFKESEEFKHMSQQISSLQDQVQQLFDNLTALRHQVDTQSAGSIGTPFGAPEYMRSMSNVPTPVVPPSPARHRTKSFSKHPRFHGPTANAFSLGVAKSSLKTMGITGPEDGDEEGTGNQDATTLDSPPRRHSMTPKTAMHADKDPIWALTKHEALRLVSVWQEEIGLMYPLLDIDKVSRHADMLFTFMEAASRAGLMHMGLPGADAIEDENTNMLKVILATVLTLEGNGKSALGEKLFSNIHRDIERTLSDPVDLRSIQVLTVAGMYHFHRDDEGLAWRTIGLAARQCLELGLHRGETYASFTDTEEHAAAIRTFWCVYVLDRRWSLGTGMPFALQDADIDQNLPKPDESTQYLNAMINYSLIGSKVWKSIANIDASHIAIDKEEIQYLDFQVLNWHRLIPSTLKFVHPDSGNQHEPPSRAIHRLQVALYLRANQMRILIYRPVLHSATNIMEYLDFAHTVVTVSKDTIRILTYLNQTSDIYKSQQTMFNWFLIAALAVLFLAVAHAPAEFSSQCRDEFYMALDLVRGLSSNSYVSKRLWKTIKSLKEVGPRLGLNIRNEANEHESAAMAMAGLAGHQVDEFAVFSNGGSHVDTPHGMAADLNTLFEAAGAFGGIMGVNGFGVSLPDTSGSTLGGGDFVTAGHLFGQEEDLAKIMRDLF